VGDIEKESHREHACGAPEPKISGWSMSEVGGMISMCSVLLPKRVYLPLARQGFTESVNS
jgi:hypothetical protein